jgi:bifunctional non-homologous end joining protein LigD
VDSVYRPGLRTDDWRKLRFVRNGEFVVIGWETAPEHPNTLSSLVLATSGDGGLKYAGRVGSGLAGPVATKIKSMLTEVDAAPAADVPAPIRGRRLRWVRPELVIEVEFSAWTEDGRLRQPVFRGVRTDKSVDEARGDG